MDFVWLGLVVILVLLSIVLIALCEQPRDAS
jgi:hypothetical protein